MKAAVIHENGDLDCVRVEDIPDPTPEQGEVVLKVRAAALNHLDIWVRKGRPGVTLQMPHVLGSDASGVVEELGPGVGNVAVGDEVVLKPGLSCGECTHCLRGEHSQCFSYGIIGMSRPGTFAEKVAVPAENLHPKPAHLNFEEASFTLSYLTAWRMLMTRAGLVVGETVLIHGIGGGVALAALQLAKLAGAEVIATSSSDEKLKRATELGADYTINYTKTSDVAARAREITSGRGVDIAFDTVGAATWPIDIEAVGRGGRIVLCGVTSGATAETNLQAVYWNHLTILGSTMGSHGEFHQLMQTVNTTKFRPIIDSTYPLDQAKEAMARMEAGEQFGKIILQMP
ncbi:MAG: zinc-binding dehydrogenase [Planctomycetes bacterium]|nr:zinc-binding dehydrogenase [Planctomycetota bacterium]